MFLSFAFPNSLPKPKYSFPNKPLPILLEFVMDLFNSILDFAVPPASMLMMAFSWPTLSFIRAADWLFQSFFAENMEDKVVVITGASSAIGEQIAYEYARRKANLVLVARRENRLHGIRENSYLLGAKYVLVMAADVVKEEDCRRFLGDTVEYFGRLDHLVNTASVGHGFLFEDVVDTSVFPHIMDINFWGNVYPTYVALPFLRQSRGRILVNASIESWLPMPRMSLFAASKAAVISFYETLRFEVRDDVGITIGTHGWIRAEMGRGSLTLEEGADMQWKQDREVPLGEGQVEEYAKLLVSGACRGASYVKHTSWFDIFLLYRVLVPDVLGWTFRLLLTSQGASRASIAGRAVQPLLEAPPTRKLLSGPRSSPVTNRAHLRSE